MALRKLALEELQELGPLESLEVIRDLGERGTRTQRVPLKRVGRSCDTVKRLLNGVLHADMIILTVRHEREVHAITLGDLFDL